MIITEIPLQSDRTIHVHGDVLNVNEATMLYIVPFIYWTGSP